jgi:hypothetical protein
MAKTQQQALAKATIQSLLATNDRAVERALIRIYERQTADEQAANTTCHNNARGFTGLDAEFLSRAAQGCKRYGHLTERQMPYVRAKMMKYWSQFAEVAAANGRPVVMAVQPTKTTDERVAEVTEQEDADADDRKQNTEIQQADALEEERRMNYKFGISSPLDPMGGNY